MLTLESGQHFEEKAVLFNEVNKFSAVAAEDAVLFTLNKNDFASLTDANLRKFLSKRLTVTQNLVCFANDIMFYSYLIIILT